MAITSLGANDSGTTSRTVINDNFTDLDTTKADLASPALTGNPTAPTQSAGNNSTRLATTAYVDAIIATSTSGVSAGPASSSTQTITHGLGRTPIIIRLDGIGSWTSASGSAMTAGGSHGTYNTTGNRCVYIAAGGTTATSGTSSTFAVRCTQADTGSAAETGYATGIVGNITSTTFDIVWTASGTVTSSQFMWEAQ